ncbi:unnamed protein product [Vitrella brassicaformis CCMP3155]|uniref:P-type domain-containing protein n=1 Tax=Vitrella brassicaformis (strain CCMP3155) TaxID=1169540 RepID=A0A0G4GSR7_VITBC|nr:unnamed protein product [Vitrella brassicaformis CCMP3155]|eukprot:CEM33733.1 unnamed protein product [Vitrella brassicaformis CCMP3155]
MRRNDGALRWLLCLFFFCCARAIRFGPFEYVHPRPEGVYVSAATQIAARYEAPIGSDSIEGRIRVRGDTSGSTEGRTVLAADNRTIVFHPDQPFAAGENVHVDIHTGIQTQLGRTVLSFSWEFSIAAHTPEVASSDDCQPRGACRSGGNMTAQELVKAEVTEGQPRYFVDENEISRLPSGSGEGSLVTPYELMGWGAPHNGSDASPRGRKAPRYPFMNGLSFMKTLQEAHPHTHNYKTLPQTYPRIRLAVPPKRGVAEGYLMVANKKAKRAMKGGTHHPYFLMVDVRGDPVVYMDGGINTDGHNPFADLSLSPNADEIALANMVMDSGYRLKRKYPPPHGYALSGYGFRVNGQGYALMVHTDRQQVQYRGHPKEVEATIVTEQDQDGNVLFEWRQWDHMSVEDIMASSIKRRKHEAADYTHPNAASWTDDGNHVYSFRHLGVMKVTKQTNTLHTCLSTPHTEVPLPSLPSGFVPAPTQVSRVTAEVMWTMGRRPNFNQFQILQDERPFSSQHDAHMVSGDTLLMLDNNNHHPPFYARMVEYHVDEKRQVATRTWDFNDHTKIFSIGDGSVQRLPNGNRGICWGGFGLLVTGEPGAVPFWTEVSSDGEKLLEMYFEDGSNSQVARKIPRNNWRGHPRWKPTLVIDTDNPSQTPTLHFSWNGATVHSSWEILRGPSPSSVTTVIARIPKRQFEHSLRVPGAGATCQYYMAVPKDEEGQQLSASDAIPSLKCPQETDKAKDEQQQQQDPDEPRLEAFAQLEGGEEFAVLGENDQRKEVASASQFGHFDPGRDRHAERKQEGEGKDGGGSGGEGSGGEGSGGSDGQENTGPWYQGPIKHGSNGALCKIAASKREQCDPVRPNMTPEECRAIGCCFRPAPKLSKTPSCYAPVQVEQRNKQPSPLEVPVQRTQAGGRCAATKADKWDCGYLGIREQECVANGCCWSRTEDGSSPWCYHVGGTCVQPKLDARRDCGFYGIGGKECQSKGCCWDTGAKPGVIKCYKPTAV